ncbi:hypothetical protein H257_18702 [Aphanomyces astaci]|uniref:DDE Tnp4 domain-containing protein n=1 Tax=Aphanomyces astaci TaxID=112090 RepID=W4FC45_APHAT|nr:hypothetical protein H257_18702 [Aphanomyces astaci]ETV64396.1 hypothetical protein H257_18702 [Aphanomyces astaci]|eukprot:XP_009846121.1 hypothetical protein H257_18702 [Aphanomyces astaci]
MARRTSLQGPHPTSLTTRSINQGVSLLNNLEMQRQAKRTRYSTHLADEPDTDTDSIAPIYDAFLKAQGLEGILTMTNFSPSEFNILWADVRSHLFKHWNVGSGRKSEVTARDLLLMLLTSLKHCGAWDVVAAVFKQKVDSFEKRVMKFLTVLYPFVMRKYVTAVGEKWTMSQLAVGGHQFKNFPYARYATDVTFQQPNVSSGSYAEKKLFYSGKHHLYGHKVEASVLPNGFAINCTYYYKGSVSDKTIFDENLDFHAANLCKEATVMDLADADDLRRFGTCMAFTNAHVRFHPLRAEDGDANSQYINRLNAIGVNMVKNKNTAQRTYRSKRKARLSMVMAAKSSLADADAGGIDTDMGSNSEIENRRGSFF